MLMLQNLPTHHWNDEEIGLLLAEAFKLKYMFADAPSHLTHKASQRRIYGNTFREMQTLGQTLALKNCCTNVPWGFSGRASCLVHEHTSLGSCYLLSAFVISPCDLRKQMKVKRQPAVISLVIHRLGLLIDLYTTKYKYDSGCYECMPTCVRI